LGNIATGLVAGLVSTGLIVIFGEIIPQAVFSRHALALGAHTVWLVRIFIFLLYPIAFPIAWALNKVLGEELGTIWSKKEIGEFIKFHEESEASGIDEDEERILLGALAFSDKTADMIATPRTVVFTVEKNRLIDQGLLQDIKVKGFSRIPVYADNKPDNIVGVLLIKDLLGLDLTQNKLVGDFARPEILMIKEKMRLDNLLNHFLLGKNHLATLFDEFGVFVGVVTLEDVVEEILKKEIMDEVDTSMDLRADAVKLMNKKLLS
jgi:metal transporter CNNM